MITPPYLKQGDRVVIVAPAKKISPERVDNAIKILTSWGLEVIQGKNLLGDYNYFSGTDETRRTDFQEALDNDQAKAIFCARGGYGSVRILDDLDFTGFLKKTKWIIGYSDITVFHNHINQVLQVETLHAPMPLDYAVNQPEDMSLQSVKNALFGEKVDMQFPWHSSNRKGSVQAPVIGGNLSVIMSLLGSVSELDFENKVLFIEEIGESLYRIDRMMVTLKRAGKLDKLKGLIVGHLTNISDNKDTYAYGKTAEDIIREAVADYKFPVCFNFPAGHDKNSISIIHGRTIQLNVADDASYFSMMSKEEGNKMDLPIQRILYSSFSIVALFVVIYLVYYLIINFLSL